MKSFKLPILLLLPFAFAQGQKDKQSAEQLDALVVESSPLDTKLNQTTQSVGILTGDELDKARASTIAGTLSDVPGVSQTQFGPSANRPIIRGQDKFRVKIVKTAQIHLASLHSPKIMRYQSTRFLWIESKYFVVPLLSYMEVVELVE